MKDGGTSSICLVEISGRMGDELDWSGLRMMSEAVLTNDDIFMKIQDSRVQLYQLLI